MHEATLTSSDTLNKLENVKSSSKTLILSIIAGLIAGLIAFYVYERKMRKSEKELEEEYENSKNLIYQYQFSEKQISNAKMLL